MSQVQIFVSSAIQKSLLRDRGLWIQSTLILLGLTTSRCAGEGGLRRAQTISRAFRQKHCAGLSSRGCLTSSSRLHQCTHQCYWESSAAKWPVLSCKLPGFKDNSHFRLSLLYSMHSIPVVLWSSAVIYFFADPSFSTSTPEFASFPFPRIAFKCPQRKSLDLFALAVGRGRYNDSNNCSNSRRAHSSKKSKSFVFLKTQTALRLHCILVCWDYCECGNRYFCLFSNRFLSLSLLRNCEGRTSKHDIFCWCFRSLKISPSHLNIRISHTSSYLQQYTKQRHELRRDSISPN